MTNRWSWRLLIGAIALGTLLWVGCGVNDTQPIVTQRNVTENDDASMASTVINSFNSFMVALEQHKSLLGINRGVSYAVYRPVEWDSMYTTIPIPGLSVMWRDTIYIRQVQGDLHILRFDFNIPPNLMYRPAQIEYGLYRYGQLNVNIGSLLPDSLRNIPIPYLIQELNMMYASNGTDTRTLEGGGAVSGAVSVNVEFNAGVGNIRYTQSDTATARVAFRNVGSQIGNFSAYLEMEGRLPYYNPLTDIRSFSRKRVDATFEVNAQGRGTATVWANGQERVRYFLEGRPYYYIGTYRVAADGFSGERPIENP